MTSETARPHVDARTRPSRSEVGPLLLVVLALLSTVAPFATDLYLPTFPQMTTDLATDATGVQLTLTSFLIGIALGQLGFGPLSDRYGRMGPLLVGSALCLAASAAAALAPTVGILVAARFVQGFGGAAGMVIGRAVISDIATGRAAARAFNILMLVGGIAPVLAPLLGGVLADALGWRGVLWVVFGLVALMLVSIVAFLRESHPRERREQHRKENAGREPALVQLTSRIYLGQTIVLGFSFAVLMAYVSASPFIYQAMMGFNAMQYGLCFGVNAVGLISVTALAARLTRRHAVRGILGTGLVVAIGSSVALLILAMTTAPAIWLAVPVFTAVAALGLILGNATSLALAEVPRAAGAGSALLGALQFGIGAAASALVGLGGEDTALPLAAVMATASAVAVAAFLWARPRGHHDATTITGC